MSLSGVRDECFGARIHQLHAFDFDYPSSILAAMPIILPEATLVRNAKRRPTAIGNKSAVATQNLPLFLDSELCVVKSSVKLG